MLARAWEKYSPHVVGLIVLALTYWFGEDFFSAAFSNQWHLEALYQSVFEVAAAAAAFLFGFYTYVKTAEGPVLREIRGSALFRRASRYMIGAIIWSAILAILTVPIMVVQPQPSHSDERLFFVFAIWAALTGYVLAAIVRSAYHFVAIMEAAYGDRLQG
jgi:FtsH-binding integral membrane protein